MKKNVVVLLTKFQCEIFQRVYETELLTNAVVIYRKELDITGHGFAGTCQLYAFEYPEAYLSFRKARTLIKQAKQIKHDLTLEKTDTFWFSNDNHPFVQVLYNCVGFLEARIMEDGLGSYVIPSILAWRRGIAAFLRKIKLILYLFPYYRCYYSACADIQAAIGYAYNDHAFPGQKSVQLITLKRTYERKKLNQAALRGDVVFVGQPLVEMRVVNRRRYLACLLKVYDQYCAEGSKLIYRPHPSESEVNLNYLELNGVNINREQNVSVEEYIYSSGCKLTVVGIASTSLIYIKNMANVDHVVAIKLPRVRGLNTYLQVLKRAGIKVV